MVFLSTQRAPSTSITTLNLPRAVPQILRLNGVKARVAGDIGVRVNKEQVLSARLRPGPIDGPTGVWGITVNGREVGEATLSVSFNNATVTGATITIFEPEVLTLPPADRDDGLLARLLLAEALSPAYTDQYVAADVETSMRWMAIVVRNRMNHPAPKDLKIAAPSAGKPTRAAVIRAPGQFHGFEDYPALGPGPRDRIAAIMKIANDYENAERDGYAAHVKAALKVAATPDAGNDPVPAPNGLYGWRKFGSGAPGGSYTRFKDFAGQTFYQLPRP